MRFSDWIKFYYLAKRRGKSEWDYKNFESFQAKRVIRFLLSSNVGLKDKKILDLGCGRGGYSAEFSKLGADVLSLDIKIPREKPEAWHFVNADAAQLPFKENSFDFVFCSSLIEHINQQGTLISEIQRVLKPGAMAYLSFPPFYTIVGGHQFKPFHYFPESTAAWLSRKINHTRSYRYNDEYGKLYITTISRVRRALLKNNFKIKSMSTRFFSINFAKLPVLNELLTWNVEFILEK